jgi:hypothetical protein
LATSSPSTEILYAKVLAAGVPASETVIVIFCVIRSSSFYQSFAKDLAVIGYITKQ